MSTPIRQSLVTRLSTIEHKVKALLDSAVEVGANPTSIGELYLLREQVRNLPEAIVAVVDEAVADAQPREIVPINEDRRPRKREVRRRAKSLTPEQQVSVECPKCGAAEGDDCNKMLYSPGTKEMIVVEPREPTRPHNERKDKVREQLGLRTRAGANAATKAKVAFTPMRMAAWESDCPTCPATAGTPCQSTKHPERGATKYMHRERSGNGNVPNVNPKEG